MTDLRSVPLPRLPPGPITGETLQPYLELLVREVLSKADIRAATGNGITITADGNVVATLDAATAIDDAIDAHNADATANTPAFAAHTALTTDVHAAADYAQTDVVESVTQPWNFTNGLVVSKASGVGIKVDPAAPTFGWKDLLGPILTRTGGTAPIFTSYLGGLWEYSFGTAAGATEVHNEFHVPHDWVPGTDAYIHSHWSTKAAPTGNVNWLYEVAFAKGYGQSVFEGTVGSGTTITVSVTQAGATAFRHEISEVQFVAAGGVLPFNDAATYSITSGAAILTSSAAAFTAGDIGTTVRILGAGAAGAALDTTISAFTSTTQVTLAANAGTTVNAVTAAAKRRVIDSATIEVDGLFLIRTWRDASRAADTLNVAPFLHAVDIHYQALFGGTKQKNGPNFYT